MSDQVKPDSEKVDKAITELFKTIDRLQKAGLTPEEAFLSVTGFTGMVIAETGKPNALYVAQRQIELSAKIAAKKDAA